MYTWWNPISPGHFGTNFNRSKSEFEGFFGCDSGRSYGTDDFISIPFPSYKNSNYYLVLAMVIERGLRGTWVIFDTTLFRIKIQSPFT